MLFGSGGIQCYRKILDGEKKFGAMSHENPEKTRANKTFQTWKQAGLGTSESWAEKGSCMMKRDHLEVQERIQRTLIGQNLKQRLFKDKCYLRSHVK